jgi:hypothetical protein
VHIPSPRSSRWLPFAFALALAAPAWAGGEVGVVTGGGKIRIFSADDQGQTVEVTVRSDGGMTFLRIEGKDGTQVGDADADPTVVEVELTPGIFEEVDVDLGAAGDDLTVDLDGLPDDLRFRKIEIEDEGDASGDDTTTVRNARLAGDDPKIKIRPGEGNDTVTVEDCDACKVDVVDAKGSNQVTIERCNIDDKLQIIGKGASIKLTVRDSFYGTAKIKTKDKGGVQPSLDARIERSSGASLDLRGDGGDDVIFLDQTSGAELKVKVKNGDDQLFVSGSVFTESRLSGGKGFDCYDVVDSALGDMDVTSFDQDFCEGAPPPTGGRAVILDYPHASLPAGTAVCLDQVIGFPCTETGPECTAERLRGDIAILGIPFTFPDLFPSFACSHGPVVDGVSGCGPDTVPLCE